jgi:D-glycero-alpha-D-manno-heptose 1-phosphate guanylyltransferase
MEVKEAIILAGGLGTRLRERVPGLPKCMAPVAGNPFLHYVISYFRKQGIEAFIFSLGHQHEVIEAYLKKQVLISNYQLSIEPEALGTGGAVRLASKKAAGESVLVINGDTFFKINLAQLSLFHENNKADCTLCLKPMEHFDRYGMVELNSHNAIISFHEKKYYENGLINGGVYALNLKMFGSEQFPEKFSFEKDYLEKFYSTRNLMGFIQDEYFIDIGIPEDYERAQVEIKNEY